MVQSVETEPFSDDGSTQASGVMAGLPPLLLGTYTPKIDAKGRMALPAKISQPAGTGHGDGPWSGAMCLSVAPIGISPDRIADPAHIHGKQGCT